MRLLSFKSNRLGGTLPPEIGGLSLLRNLDVSKNSMTGNIPESYGNLELLGSLYLSENSFSGEIPSSFNQLTELTIFTAERNSLTGVMPAGICGINRLTADCVPGANEEVFCEPGCCTACCIDGGGCREITSPPTDALTDFPTDGVPGTEAPTTFVTDSPRTAPPTVPDVMETDAPTSSLSNAPTSSPTDTATEFVTEDNSSSSTNAPDTPGSSCQASISTDRTCYEDGDDIFITFENCDSTEFDWIGIYPIFADVSQLGEPLAWVWSCGDQFCSNAVDVGQAIFYNARGEGTFIVYLLRSNENINGPFEAYGIGNAFEMSTDCSNR